MQCYCFVTTIVSVSSMKSLSSWHYLFTLTINNPIFKRNIWLYEPLGNSGTMNLNLELVRWRCSIIMPLLSSELTASSNFISNSPHNSRILFKSAIAILEHVLKGDYSRIPYKISLNKKKKYVQLWLSTTSYSS